MIDYVYFYAPRSYSPGRVYRRFEDALAQFLHDEGFDSLSQMAAELNEYNSEVSYDFDPDNGSVSVDDGGYITMMEFL